MSQKTAAEIIAARADAEKPSMGLTSWSGGKVRKSDISTAKNYLNEDEITALNLIYFDHLRNLSIFTHIPQMKHPPRMPTHKSRSRKPTPKTAYLGYCRGDYPQPRQFS